MPTCPECGEENPSKASFCMSCGASLATAPAPGEIRKTVTALFCDLVGSTSLGETHDPEVLRPLLERYFDEMRGAVERHGGTVQKFIGDAVAAIFGLPTTHEDDALRAVRAGIEMQERMAALNEDSPIPLSCRIGMTTGEVLVPGDGKPIIGDAMNTASRLQSGAEPGWVLIGEPTWRLVRDSVEVEEIEPLHAKGKAAPVSAYRVLRLRAIATRSETPLMGRSRHLTMLRRSLEDAIDDNACVLVSVLAPPGVGKSRLAAAFAEEVSGSATVLIGQTPSYGEGVTFAPLVELLSQAAGLPIGDAEQVAAALRDRLAAQPDGPAVSDRLAQTLGIGEALASDASWAVRRLLEVVATDRPLVVVLEDVHWAEPPMLDLVDAVVERVHGAVMFLCLARPELLDQRPTWAAGKPRALTATLPPLSPADARRVAEILVGPGAPAYVVDRLCEAAEGNPLYLEQLSAMLTDQGLLDEGRWVGTPDAAVEIPATLQALLAARLDHLDPSPRLVLERASVVGRRFRIAAVRALAPDLSDDETDAVIATLDRRGLIHPEDEATGRWQFAHALILDAAYRGLSKELRADLHEQLADWMAARDADQADADESVARHLERALHLREELGIRDERSMALSERAGELFAAAGSRAFAALDYITARDLLGRAAILLPERSPRRLDLLPNLGAALSESGRTEETEALLSEAIEEARATGSERDALRAAVQLVSNRIYRSPTDAELEAGVVEARSAVEAFEVMEDDLGLAEASLVALDLEFMRGRCAASTRWAGKALRHALAGGHSREATRAAGDVFGITIVGPLPFDAFPGEAEELLSMDEPLSGSVGHALLAAAALAAGDDQAFKDHEGRWRDTVDRNGLAWLSAIHGMEIAFLEIAVGRAEAGERRLREAREYVAAIGNVWYASIIDEFLCAAVGAQGRKHEFLRLADALEVSVPVTARLDLIKRQLIQAQAHLLRGSTVEAEAATRRALKLSESTDILAGHADALLMLSEVLEARGLQEDAATARGEAIEKLRAKGNLAAIARLES
jgi:class 3 adenylate cyclase/tetratricopeptide (TPR) repeat protein